MSSRTQLVRAVSRRAHINGHVYVVQLSPDGVSFRELRRRFRVVAPLALVLAMAERLAGEELKRLREGLRKPRSRS